VTAVRLADLVQPCIGAGCRITILDPAPSNLESYLTAFAGASLDRRPLAGPGDGGHFGEGALAVAVASRQSQSGLHLAELLPVLTKLDQGGRLLLLFGDEPDRIAYPMLLAELGKQGCQIIRTGTLDYGHLRHGIVVQRVERLLPVWGPAGAALSFGTQGDSRAASEDGDAVDLATLLRLANEFAILDLRVRAGRQQAPENVRRGDRQGSDSAHAETPQTVLTAAQLARAEHELRDERRRSDELERGLRDLQGRLKRAEAQVRMVERSTSLRVGRAMVAAARKPGSNTLRLPMALYRAARPAPPGDSAGAPSPTGPRPPRAMTTKGHAPLSSGHERLFVSRRPTTLAPVERMAIAGILRPQTAAALEPDCDLTVLTPNDARPTLERIEVDCLLVEAAASRPGHPWSGFAQLGHAERQRQLLDLVSASQAKGIPVVYWRNVAPNEALAAQDLASRCDLIMAESPQRADEVRWTRGVQLAGLAPLWPVDNAPSAPVYVGNWDPRAAPRHRALLSQVLSALRPLGLRIYAERLADGPFPYPGVLGSHVAGQLGWWERLDLLSRSPVQLASPFCAGRTQPDDALLEQLASGAHVVAGPSAARSQSLNAALTIVEDAVRAVEAVREAMDAGPRTVQDTRVVLRALWSGHTVAHQLDVLGKLLGRPAGPEASPAASVLASVRSSGELPSLTAAVLGQRHHPRALVLCLSQDVQADGAIDEMTAAGVQVHVTSEAPETTTWSSLAAYTDSPLVAPWSPRDAWSPYHLTDLLIGRAASRGAVVAYSTHDTGRHPALSRSLAERDVLLRLGQTNDDRQDYGSWVARGLTVCTLPEIDTATAPLP
jgi:hypothetical protein